MSKEGLRNVCRPLRSFLAHMVLPQVGSDHSRKLSTCGPTLNLFNCFACTLVMYTPMVSAEIVPRELHCSKNLAPFTPLIINVSTCPPNACKMRSEWVRVCVSMCACVCILCVCGCVSVGLCFWMEHDLDKYAVHVVAYSTFKWSQVWLLI